MQCDTVILFWENIRIKTNNWYEIIGSYWLQLPLLPSASIFL
jgi:hypothetical protein